VAPSGANVLAATLGSSAGLITYDSRPAAPRWSRSVRRHAADLTGGKLSLTGSGTTPPTSAAH
jgi:hypothetical protein